MDENNELTSEQEKIADEQDSEVFLRNEIYFKYKCLETTEQLEQLYQILYEKKLFLSKINALNDPFEGAQRLLCEKISNCNFDKYKVCSLSKSAFSVLMWCHYCKRFKGVCVGIKFDCEQKNDLQEVTYSKMTSWTIDENLDEKFALSFKDECWKYENEVRIIEETNEKSQQYYNLRGNSNIECLIIGNEVNNCVAEILEEKCRKKNIKVFRAKTSKENFGVEICSAYPNKSFECNKTFIEYLKEEK